MINWHGPIVDNDRDQIPLPFNSDKSDIDENKSLSVGTFGSFVEKAMIKPVDAFDSKPRY